MNTNTNTNYKYVKDWRKRTKERILSLFDSKCYLCGYNRCSNSLEFHHLDPSKKCFDIGGLHKIMNWNSLIEEVKKCICLCSNCHREVHAGLIFLPPDLKIVLDITKIESYGKENIKKLIINEIQSGELTIEKFTKKYKCSKSTVYSKLDELNICIPRKQKINISKEELEELLKVNPLTKIGIMFSVTDNAVKKRCIALGIQIPKRKGEWTRTVINEKVMELYKQNLSTIEISEILKKPLIEIEKILKSKTKKCRQLPPNIDQNEVINLFCNGMSERLIADFLKCRRSNIRIIIKNWIKHYPV